MTTDMWKTDTLEGLGKASRVWYRAGPRSWEQGTLQSMAGDVCTLALDSPMGEGTGKVVEAPTTDVLPANPSMLELVPDLTTLSFLSEPSILHTLRQRYSADTIYTHAGPVLIAINPFKRVDLYTPEHVQRYVSRPATGQSSQGYEPHIFLTADKAFKQMVANDASQSILITGESGAGKTETTKFVMKYLAGLAGGTGMEDRVLETNPILEAFGNAKTIHNNNSSRFGKLIEIYFNRSRAISGALIQTYLLEKSRVVHQLPGERSYHIFYQLCRGASPEDRAACSLPDPAQLEQFAYLRSSGCTTIAGVDDAADFAEVQRAMVDVGITPEQQRGIWRVLSAVLWLGNVEFESAGESSDAVNVAGGTSSEALSTAAALLSVPPEELAEALTRRRMVAGGERITRELSMDAALENRDAMAKAVYEAQFRWLVNQINTALAVGSGTAATSLCILDIYGFECFAENSFEQLCINYANERLQQQFAAHLFKLEQAAYEEEGVDWARIDFEDNQECVELIEARPPAGVGLLSLLDEECMFPKGSDTSFAAKLRHTHSDHPRFGYNAKNPGDDFTLHHYAGPVVYSAARFLDKNRDALSPDLVGVLAVAGDALVVALAGEMTKGQERSKGQTVAARFRDQLKDLMARLDQTQLHFVRCIKPNGRQEPSSFDAALSLHQLRCCGILEVARIARAGYPTRYLHSDFAERYRLLLPGLAPGPLPRGVTVLDVCTQLLEHFGVDSGLYQVGRTKIFFRAGVLGQLEDRASRVTRSVLEIQSVWRMACCRREFLRTKEAAIVLQSAWRTTSARQEYIILRDQSRAAVAIQAAFRAHMERQRFLRAQAAVLAIQMGWRWCEFNRRVAVRTELRAQEEAANAEEAARVAAEMAEREAQAREAALQAEQESSSKLQEQYGIDGEQVREILALWYTHGSNFDEFLAWWATERAAGQEAQARVAELEEKLEAYGELKSYAEQLEVEANELRDENLMLMEQRAAQLEAEASGKHLPAIITVMATSGGANEDPVEFSTPAPDTGRYSQATEDTVSIMSYSDSEAATPSASASAGGERSGGGRLRGRRRNGLQEVSFGRAGPAGAVAALSAELDKKAGVFDDDAAFIREVHEGVSAAPSMDPEAEIQRLLTRYKLWQRDFKSRLKNTQTSLKKFQGSPGASGGGVASTPRGNDGSLTSRLMVFARGPRSAGPVASR